MCVQMGDWARAELAPRHPARVRNAHRRNNGQGRVFSRCRPSMRWWYAPRTSHWALGVSTSAVPPPQQSSTSNATTWPSTRDPATPLSTVGCASATAAAKQPGLSRRITLRCLLIHPVLLRRLPGSLDRNWIPPGSQTGSRRRRGRDAHGLLRCSRPSAWAVACAPDHAAEAPTR